MRASPHWRPQRALASSEKGKVNNNNNNNTRTQANAQKTEEQDEGSQGKWFTVAEWCSLGLSSTILRRRFPSWPIRRGHHCWSQG